MRCGRAARASTCAALGAWGASQSLVGLYFIFLRPSFLPEDLRFARPSGPHIEAAAPGMDAWLQWVFAVLGGQMTAVGILVIAFSWRVWRGADPTRSDAAAFAGAGAFTVLLMSGVNFAIGSEFRWILVLPVILWLGAVILVSRLARSI